METGRGLVLIGDLSPVAAVGDKADRTYKMGGMRADRMPLKELLAASQHELVVGEGLLVVLNSRLSWFNGR